MTDDNGLTSSMVLNPGHAYVPATAAANESTVLPLSAVLLSAVLLSAVLMSFAGAALIGTTLLAPSKNCASVGSGKSPATTIPGPVATLVTGSATAIPAPLTPASSPNTNTHLTISSPNH
jgi:hypothetical protein